MLFDADPSVYDQFQKTKDIPSCIICWPLLHSIQ